MKPVAVVCSDLHLTLHPPACRAETDWLAVQRQYLRTLRKIAGNLPVLCAGDIFDRWGPPPELIRFAINELPTDMVCIPGQHDLPNHRLDLMHRSGYGVLVAAEKIQHLDEPMAIGDLLVFGSAWDQPIPVPKPTQRPAILLAHRYVWATEKQAYPGAPESACLGNFKKALAPYEAAIFGDNHKGFSVQCGKCAVFNCGGFLRRKADERQYQPRVGILKWSPDGVVVEPVLLDCTNDKFLAAEKEQTETPVDLKDFLDQLENLGEHGLDFRETVTNYLRGAELSARAKEIVLEALE